MTDLLPPVAENVDDNTQLQISSYINLKHSRCIGVNYYELPASDSIWYALGIARQGKFRCH